MKMIVVLRHLLELALLHLRMIVVLRHLLELVLLHLKTIVVLRRLLELILLLRRHLKRLCDVARLAEGIYRRTQVPRTVVEGTTAGGHGLNYQSYLLHLVGAVTRILDSFLRFEPVRRRRLLCVLVEALLRLPLSIAILSEADMT